MSIANFVIVGPEVPLAAGVVDRFQAAGLRIFGPVQDAAQLEGSKAFSKAFMQRHGIPTAQARVFSDFESAADFVWTLESVPVIKASGLAAGTGVILPDSRDEAVDVLLAGDESRLTGRQQVQVLRNARTIAGAPELGLRIGRQLKPASHGPIGYLALSSPDLLTALQSLRDFLPLRIPFAQLDINEDGS